MDNAITSNQDMLLTVQEVAAILKTNTGYVYRLIETGKLKVMKIGRYKCRRTTLEAFLEEYEGMDISDPENIRELRTEGNNGI